MARHIPALRVHQWLPEWEEVEFSAENHRRKPLDNFLLFSLEASELRRLCGIQRRKTLPGVSRSGDLGIQRRHDPERSKEISRFVRYGFPWSSLPANKQDDPSYSNLKMPGWLPTAVIVNILSQEDVRNNESVDEQNQVAVHNNADGTCTIEIPGGQGNDRESNGLAPLEIIDGQHRLWAFDEDDQTGLEYQIPVVAFVGLDRSWQAYLFYTINIKPKRINTSLAFDLYPLLRTENWLDRFEGHSVYRETRAQELTEHLWSHPESPWFNRINMLGERGTKMVSQASWVRNLQATMVRSWEGPRIKIGGLYGAPAGKDQLVLPWTRVQQAAFLIYSWLHFSKAIQELRDQGKDSEYPILGLDHRDTMLNSDMGVRGFLYLLNDLCYMRSEELDLRSWIFDGQDFSTVQEEISEAIKSIVELPVGSFVQDLVVPLASFDWRASKAEGLNQVEQQAKARFRGSTGYRELRIELLRYMANEARGEMSDTAEEIIDVLGYAS